MKNSRFSYWTGVSIIEGGGKEQGQDWNPPFLGDIIGLQGQDAALSTICLGAHPPLFDPYLLGGADFRRYY